MKILVVDGQGGGIGRRLIEALREKGLRGEIFACGTNGAAALNMQKGGADYVFHGTVPIIRESETADVITGPIGIVMSGALLGEITSGIAQALSCAKAARVLIPLNKCNTFIVGVSDNTLARNIALAAEKIVALSSSAE